MNDIIISSPLHKASELYCNCRYACVGNGNSIVIYRDNSPKLKFFKLLKSIWFFKLNDIYTSKESEKIYTKYQFIRTQRLCTIITILF